MASRTSANTGMIVLVSIFALLTVVFFVVFIIALAKSQKLERDNEVQRDRAERAVLVRGSEFEQLASQAGPGKGVVDLLLEREEEAARWLGGPNSRTLEDARARVGKSLAYNGQESASVAAHLTLLSREISSLQSELASTKEQLVRAQSDRSAAEGERDALRQQFQQATGDVETQIGEYGDQVNDQLRELGEARADLDTRREELIAQHSTELESRDSSLQQAQQQIFVLEELVARLQRDGRGSVVQPVFEGSLADGTVAGVDAPSNQAFINLGRDKHLVIGMTFEVYSDASAIRPDEEGNYPPGKATIEVTRIDQGSSRARIVRENRGTPIVEGDVIANAIYDPGKTYNFTVFGNFDTNNDGFHTHAEADEVRGIISEWGGVVQDAVSGDTDFIVLGSRPVPPPQPRADDPVEVILRWSQLRAQADEYDNVFKMAERTSIPILNANRLFTLTGLHGRR